MPVTKCVVNGCGSSGCSDVLYCFPRSRDLRGIWLQLLAPHASQLRGKVPSDVVSQKVCVKHFESKQLRICGDKQKKVHGAYPTLFTQDEILSGRPNVAVTLNDPTIHEEHSYCLSTHLGHDHTYSKHSKNLVMLAHSTGTDVPDKESSDGACPKQQEAMKKLQDVDDWMGYIGVKGNSRSRQDNQAVCSNNFKDEPINLEEGIDPSCLDPEFDEPPTEAIFSWQKEEILYPTDDTDVLMAVKRSDQLQELDDLSLYDDERIANDEETHKEAEYQCNVCEAKIIGFHYTCVQCADFDLCGACEANGAHNSHYVLRVPKDRPYNEIQTVLAAIRQQLLAENLFLSEQIIENSVKSEPEDDLGGSTGPEGPEQGGEGGPDDPLRHPTPDPAPEAQLPTRSDDEYSDGSEYRPSRRKRRRRFFDINNANSASDSDSNSDSSTVTTLSSRKPHDQDKARKKPETRSARKHPVHGRQIVTDLTDRQPVDVFENTHENGLTPVELTSISQTHNSYSTRKSLTSTSIKPIETMDLDPLESLDSTGPPINQLNNQTENNDILEISGTFYEVPGDIKDLDAILEVPDGETVVVQETPPTPLAMNIIDNGKNVCDVRTDVGEVLHLRVPPDTNDEALAQALHSKAFVALEPLVIQWVIADR